jgi:hypothetical protein
VLRQQHEGSLETSLPFLPLHQACLHGMRKRPKLMRNLLAISIIPDERLSHAK